MTHSATIHGGRFALPREGELLRIDSRGDHRIAMSLAIAGQCCDREFAIADVANVATSFPGFDELARTAGFSLASAT